MTDRKQLEQFLINRRPWILMQTFEEEYVLGLLREIALEMQLELWIWSATDGLRDGLLSGSVPVANTDKAGAALYSLTRDRRRPGIYVMLDLGPHLKDDRTLRCLREAVDELAKGGSQLVMIDCCQTLPAVVVADATKFTPSLPDEQEIQEILTSTLRYLNNQQRIDVHVSREDLNAIVKNLCGLSRRQCKQVIYDSVFDDRRFDASDISRILAEKRRAIGSDGVLEFVESPASMDDIGGLNHLKSWLAQRRNCLTDAAAKFGITPPRGILMLGVQGAGKSLAAKAVATAWHRPLLRLDAGNLYDRYIGESERRLRDALLQAERMAPVVLWIDEIEKGFASAASLSTDGGLSKRMFGTLLTWMQEHTAPVFLMATANDIEALPPELLRKGRFDEIFFIDLPGLEARTQIASIHLRKRKRDPQKFDLPAIAEACDGFSGAEIEQAIISALHDAFAGQKDLTTAHILAAMKASPPLSITMAEKLRELQDWARGRCVPAD
jgi:AAA+ superfamily predicted ATPase